MGLRRVIQSAMADDPKNDANTEAETAARREATLKVMLATPHKPHKAGSQRTKLKP